jgi:hypothetical protein
MDNILYTMVGSKCSEVVMEFTKVKYAKNHKWKHITIGVLAKSTKAYKLI